jgi:hypothetical protein
VFCALFLNIYSLYFHSITDFTASISGVSIATLTWIMSIVFLGISILVLFPSKKTVSNKEKDLTVTEKILVSIALIFGLILRVYKLNHLGLYLDEWYWLTNAKGILDGVIRSPFGFIGDQPSNMPAYTVAFFLAIFKDSYLAVRLPGVLYSLLNTIFIFSFLKEAFNKKVALVGVFILSFSIWDIHMSQFGWNNVNLNPFLISGAMLFLYRGIKKFSVRNIFICGIFIGISINLLYIASLSIISTILYFLYSFILSKEKAKIIKLFFLLILTITLIISPTIVKVCKFPQQSIARHKTFLSENVAYSKNQKGIFYYLDQLKLGFEDFTYKPEKFNIPALWGITLEPFVYYCFVIGLLYSLLYIMRPPFFLILVNYVLMFIPIVVLYRFTSVWREFGFLPTIYMLAAIGLVALQKIISRLIRLIQSKKTHDYSNIILIIIAVIFFVSWYYFYSRYYDNHLKNEPNIYETYCKKTSDYILKNIKPKTLILLPNEMCNDLIKISLWDKYNYQSYGSLASLAYALKTNKHGAIIKISHNLVTNFYTRDLFDDGDLRSMDFKIIDKQTIQKDNIIYAYIYKF